jgi:hypothetical protein
VSTEPEHPQHPSIGSPPGPPPLVCQTCAASPLHHALDLRRQAFYCAHREVFVIWNSKTGRWQARQNVDQATARQLFDAAAGVAIALGSQGLTFTMERGVFRAGP